MSDDEFRKTYLLVPYDQKDYAKSLGAKWDPTKKKWYADTFEAYQKLEEFEDLFMPVLETANNASDATACFSHARHDYTSRKLYEEAMHLVNITLYKALGRGDTKPYEKNAAKKDLLFLNRDLL